jgi:hypothetical protein
MTLVDAGVMRESDVPNYAALRTRLLHGADGLPNELEIGYCHRLEPEEEFRMLPGYSNFDAVVEGQLLARSGPSLEREVRAPWTGTLLMPRYQGQASTASSSAAARSARAEFSTLSPPETLGASWNAIFSSSIAKSSCRSNGP